MVPVLVVELTAVALVALGVPGLVPDEATLLQAGLIAIFGLLHTEVVVGVERVRRRIADEAPHVDLSSVWTFSAAVLLPTSLAAAVAAVVFMHLWWRSWRGRVPLFKQLYSTATVVLACVAASAVVQRTTEALPGVEPFPSGNVVGIVLAMLAYTTVNSCLVAGAIAMSSARPNMAAAFGGLADNVLELGTLSLGAVTAVAMTINPWLVLFVLPPLLVLHRAVLVRHLEEAASIDGKTKLLNAAAWHSQAERELRRSVRDDAARGVLVLGLDHFKAVNDTHGHIAGDHVLAAVAEALQDEVRERDLVGRFGGEEFVVLLTGLAAGGAAELEAVAERIRLRVARLRVQIPTPDGPLTVAGLSISIGAALHPGPGGDLHALLQIADAALYTAKRAGRNAVRLGLSLPVQATGTAGAVEHA
jgi:diguanylate cyclase (GGDEF)-like protein